MISKVLIKGVSIWSGDGFSAPADLLVADGRILRIGHGLVDEDARTVVAHGWLALPGLVDLHAHLGEPGREDRESLESGLAAAGAGGFTHVVAMPDTVPPVDTEATAQYVRRRAEAVARAELLVCGALSKGREGKELAELAHLAEAGAVLLGDARPVGDPSLLRRGLQYATMLGIAVASPAADESLSRGGAVHEGSAGHWLGLPGIPPSAEWTALARDLLIAEEVGGRLHVQGISTARSAELLRDAKERGVAVTAEVSLHNLLFTDSALADYDTSKKVMPPLRPQADVESIIDALEAGVVDCIVTDHTPCTVEEKDAEFDQAPFGAAGLEVALPALYTYLIREGKLSWRTLVEAMSVRPRRVIGLAEARIEEGARCDLTLFAPGESWRVDPLTWRSRARNTPLAGQALSGRVQGTLLGTRAFGPCFDEPDPTGRR